MVDDVFLRDFFEFKMLATGDDGRRNLVELGRGENEDRMGRRLFQGLEKSIERFSCQHMNFIDDNDLIPAVNGPVLDAFPERPHLIDAPVGSAVDLEHIHGAVFVDLFTEFTFVAGGGCGPGLAVQGLGQDSGCGRFPDSPHPGKNISLCDPVVFDSILKSLDDGLLADHLLESLRPVLAGVNQIGHL